MNSFDQLGVSEALTLPMGVSPAGFESAFKKPRGRRRARGVAIALAGLWAVSRASARPQDSAEESAQRARQLIEQRDLTGARAELSRALEAHPQDGGLYDLLGVVAAEQHDYTEAKENFQRAIRLDAKLTGAYLNLGRLYQEQGAGDAEALRKALETYAALLRLEPANAEARYQSAVILERRRAYAASLEHLSRLSPEGLNRAQSLAVRLADHAGLGDSAAAEADARRLLAAPDLVEADVLSILPTLEARHADTLEARLLEGLDARGRASADALTRLASAYERRRDFAKARATLERAYALKPDTASTLVRLARVANAGGDTKGALGYLAHARDLEPANASIHYLFGAVCVEEDLVQEAYTSFKKAVELEPDNPFYNYAFGSVAVQREDSREAIPYFEKFLRLRPHEPRGRLALGTACFLSRDFDCARKELLAAGASPATAAAAHYYLGRIASQEGDLPAALAELRKAVQLAPGFADAHAQLGTVLMKRKENSEAEEAFRKALSLDPDNYTGNLNLMVLYQRTGDGRAEGQSHRFEEVKQKRAEKARELLRTIEVQP